MKNRHTAVLILITCVFASFTLGFLLGRTTAPGDTIVAQAPDQTQPATLPPETSAAQALTPVPSDAASEPLETAAASEPSETAATGRININTATLDQLDSLPGIGPVLAQRIIDYREAYGPFTALSQLTLVEGIGQKRLEALLDMITIE